MKKIVSSKESYYLRSGDKNDYENFLRVQARKIKILMKEPKDYANDRSNNLII